MGLAWYAEKGPGDCMGPKDNSVREAARDEARPEAVAVIADFIFDERMALLAWISDAQGDFSQAEYDAITQAILDGDAMEVGRITIEATRRSIRRGAQQEAEILFDRMEREDEAGHLIEQTEH